MENKPIYPRECTLLQYYDGRCFPFLFVIPSYKIKLFKEKYTLKILTIYCKLENHSNFRLLCFVDAYAWTKFEY